jgi:hypothetical protein
MLAVITRRLALAAGAAAALPIKAPAAPLPAPDAAWFLDLSRAATGHDDLDPTTAARLLSAMDEADPGFSGRAAALARLARPGMAPEDLLAAAAEPALKRCMLSLVAAWYTGTAGDGVTGTAVAYADALMYRATVDAAPVQTYCGGGPLWWTAEPPALGIALAAPAAGAPVSPAPAGKEAPSQGSAPEGSAR